VDEDGQDEGDKEKDAHAERVSGEDLCDAVKAVLGRDAIVHGLEVIEEAWVADTVAVESVLKISGKANEVS